MARNTESDGTYCSEVEKQDRNKIRRSKRLSQRNLHSFRSNQDSIERLYEIYEMLKCGKLCSKWLIDDWQSLKFEVELIQKTLRGKQKGRISFILKKINEKLRKSSPRPLNEPSAIIQQNQNNEQLNSPNILAGMMTEVLTEIPPYQPECLAETINTVKHSEVSIALTQKNPLDLTRKNEEVQVVSDKVLSQNISERQKQQATKTLLRAVPFKSQEKIKTPRAKKALGYSKDSMIDLTEENADKTNRENVAPVIKERNAKSKSPIHISKWYQLLPTQQRPKLTEQSSRETTNNSLKSSILKLYRDQTEATSSMANTIQKPLRTSCPRKPPKQIKQLNSAPTRLHSNTKLGQKPFQNTETILTRDPPLPRMSPRNVQSEHFGNISPDYLLDDISDLSASDMNDSGTSLTPSLKDSLRKVFGTDNLNNVFSCDEMVYNLTENHVRRLATALNIKYDVLKKAIETILSNDNYKIFEDENMQSDSSVVECSQSPPQRLFPSQRSQT